jgi:lipopolysaccharide transport protein LptA/LPS export ABC transporter protein LptC
MTQRSLAVYIAAGFIAAILVLTVYFFSRKPPTPAAMKPEDTQKVLIFRDVKYTGERKGVVDWEIRAKVVRQSIDKMQIVELEGIEGEYKPDPGTVVSFKGTKGRMDREKEFATVEGVEILYKGEYTIRSGIMDIDFGKSLASTKAAVELAGKKVSMMGIGLNADMKEQVINLEKDVTGTINAEKQRIRFSSDRFTYFIKDGTYIFDGRVVTKGDQMNMLCDQVKVLSNGETIERADATGHVRIVSKGVVAKSERAVYYLKEDRVVLDQEPKVVREGGEMLGETITYDLKTDQFHVQKPKVRIEQRPGAKSNKDKG